MKHLIAAAALAGISIAMPITALSADMALALGQFRNADGIHTGEGTATIAKSGDGALHLELTQFQTIPGPDLKVWLVEAADIQSSNDVKQSEWLALGPLQSARGDQTYAIPAGTDISKYGSAVVWCEEFGVLFTTADLAPAK